MNRARNIVIALVALGLVVAGALAWLNWNSTPRLITGDIWTYGLSPAATSGLWTLSEETVFDGHQLAAVEAATDTVEIPGLLYLYSASYVAEATNPSYADLGVRLLHFETSEDAAAALAAETLGEGWGGVESAVAGADESRIWRYTDPDAAIRQGLWRADFRVLNVIGSVSLLASEVAAPDPSLVIGYAGQIAEALRSRPTPAVLQAASLFQAGPTDVRPYLLGSRQLAELDAQYGDRWMINTGQLPSFTTNAQFSVDAQPVLDRLGRQVGYQSYWVKGITQEEELRAVGVLLFQQVSVYKDIEGATSGLNAMVGLSTGSELTPGPSVGDAARKWVIITQPGQNPDGQSVVVEINFRVGRYVASVQVTSRPVESESAAITLSGPTDTLAEALARQLAENLSSAP
jgi:hypothetical protein